MQQQRRDNVDDIEMSLLQHQLALFPHLEDSVPPEVCHHLTYLVLLLSTAINIIVTINVIYWLQSQDA